MKKKLKVEKVSVCMCVFFWGGGDRVKVIIYREFHYIWLSLVGQLISCNITIIIIPISGK